MDHALIALLALAANLLLGGPRALYLRLGFARLVQWPGQLARHLERKLNRKHRSLAERRARGMVLLVVGLVVPALLGLVIGALPAGIGEWVTLALLVCLLPARPLWDRLSQLRRALQQGQLAQAHSVFEGTTVRHHAVLDAHSLARAGVEMMAVGACEKILLPLMAYLLGGLPLLLSCASLCALHAALRRPGSAGDMFTAPLSGLYHGVLWVPVRVGGLLWVGAAALSPLGQWREAFSEYKQALGRPRGHEAPALCAVAGALSISLGGPGSVYGQGGWCGRGPVRIGAAELARAQRLFAFFLALLFVLFGLFIG